MDTVDEPGRQPWGRLAVLPSGCSFPTRPVFLCVGPGGVQGSASSSDWVSPWRETPSPTPLTKMLLLTRPGLQVGYWPSTTTDSLPSRNVNERNQSSGINAARCVEPHHISGPSTPAGLFLSASTPVPIPSTRSGHSFRPQKGIYRSGSCRTSGPPVGASLRAALGGGPLGRASHDSLSLGRFVF